MNIHSLIAIIILSLTISYTNTHASSPEDKLLVDRGWDLQKEGNSSEAICELSKAIKINPQNILAHIYRGMVFQEKEQYDLAIEDYSEVIRINSSIGFAYVKRAQCWSEKGIFYKAITDCTEAIKINPKDDTAYFERGNLWEFTGEYTAAIQDFTEALKTDPNDILTYIRRGANWAKKIHLKNALADFDKAIEIDPMDSRIYFERGNAFVVNKKFQEAVSDYSYAIQLDSESTFMLTRLAWLLSTCQDSKIRNGTEALRLAQKAFNISQSFNSLSMVAAAYAELGEFSKAVENQEKAIEIAKQKDISMKFIAQYQDYLGQYRLNMPWRLVITYKKTRISNSK